MAKFESVGEDEDLDVSADDMLFIRGAALAMAAIFLATTVTEDPEKAILAAKRFETYILEGE